MALALALEANPIVAASKTKATRPVMIHNIESVFFDMFASPKDGDLNRTCEGTPCRANTYVVTEIFHAGGRPAHSRPPGAVSTAEPI